MRPTNKEAELDLDRRSVLDRQAKRGSPVHEFSIPQPSNMTKTMSSPTASTTPTTSPTDDTLQQRTAPEECITCRIIGTGALAGVGFYALQMSRPKAPGSILGKRIMGGVGVCESRRVV